MLKSFLCSHSLVRVHFKKTFHEVDFNLIHDRSISGFKRFGMLNVRELETLISCVPTKLILKEIRKRPKHLLNDIELVDFRITRK